MKPRFTVNMNGTSVEELMKQAGDVLESCDALEQAMRRAAPNARDYQTNRLPGDDYKADRIEWEAMMVNVKAIQRWAEARISHAMGDA